MIRRPARLRLLPVALACLMLVGGLGGFAAWLTISRLPPLPLPSVIATSTVVAAADGRPLRMYLTHDDAWRLPIARPDVPSTYLDLLIAYEDKRFWSHSGVDVLALARAAAFSVTGRQAGGASTLTMQVARLLEPGHRGLKGKLRQIVRALEIERRLSKWDILSIYLHLAPFGRNIQGLEAASRIYFERPASTLDPGEAALLVAIAQSPTRRRPDRHPEIAARARDRVLARGVTAGVLEGHAAQRYAGQPVAVREASVEIHAAHFADRLTRAGTTSGSVVTTLDYALQLRVEALVRDGVASWPRTHAALMVLDHRNCEIKAYAGSADFLASDDSGQFDHVRALRSPGSTLKPLIYALGFEGLHVHPETLLRDQPVVFDGYAPRNFNTGYSGDMTTREALIRSINTTAVMVLARIGPPHLLSRLRSAQIPIRTDDADVAAGLAVGLGGAGVSLEGLVRLYAAFARRGSSCPANLEGGVYRGDAAGVTTPEAAWAIADILADVPPPPGFSVRRSADGGRRIAYKTGTSYGFRDAWAIGFDKNHTVGVWVGRSDATPQLGATGGEVAAPIFYRVFDGLSPPSGDVAGPPPIETVLARRTGLPERLATFGTTHNERRLRILFPAENAVVEGGDQGREMTLVATGGAMPYYWFIDGVPLEADGPQARWRPRGGGQVTAKVMDNTGTRSEVSFWVK